jgi:hypothetical protein
MDGGARRTICVAAAGERVMMVMGTQQSTVQAVNQTIREFADDPRVPREEQWEFFCECGCFTLVPMTIAQFDEAAGVWAPGHGTPAAPLLN